MKVFLDHNMPKRVRRFLVGHEVWTAREMGWAELENGELLDAAESARFDVMVTGDKNLSYQQNLSGRVLALVILGSNNWNIVKENPDLVVQAVNTATPGSFQIVTVER